MGQSAAAAAQQTTAHKEIRARIIIMQIKSEVNKAIAPSP